MIKITGWIKSHQNFSSVGVHSSSDVKGLYKKVLGGRALFAEVVISISPPDELKFTQQLSNNDYEIAKNEGWIKGICFGVLDVMVARPLVPVTIFDCCIKSISYHDID